MIHNGLSGCKLEIIDSGILRKYSSSLDYNTRLLKQVDKQILFSKLILKNIDTPKVLATQYDQIYSFDMEYIPGLSSYEYFSLVNVYGIEFVIQTLFDYFDYFSDNARDLIINNKIIEKINFLQIKTKYPDYLEYLKTYVNNNQIIVPKTFCHGDLTFNNIIFHKNRLFFIDFLDSYVDSFFCDLVKLKQDLYHLWSLKVQKEKTLRLIQTYRYIWKHLSKRYEKYINTKGFEILDVLNTLRIEPYLTNNNQRSILDTIVKSTKLYEKFDYSNGRKIQQIS
jgi:hypothetical protein